MKGERLETAIFNGRKIIDQFSDLIDSRLIGSAAYLPEANDVDFILLVSGDVGCKINQLVEVGWENCSEYNEMSGCWGAVRGGDINLILTDDPDFFNKFVAAMEVCRLLKIEDKRTRVAICQIVRDGKAVEQVDADFTLKA